jgi:hypothetical protein
MYVASMRGPGSMTCPTNPLPLPKREGGGHSQKIRNFIVSGTLKNVTLSRVDCTQRGASLDHFGLSPGRRSNFMSTILPGSDDSYVMNGKQTHHLVEIHFSSYTQTRICFTILLSEINIICTEPTILCT